MRSKYETLLADRTNAYENQLAKSDGKFQQLKNTNKNIFTHIFRSHTKYKKLHSVRKPRNSQFRAFRRFHFLDDFTKIIF